MDQQHYVGLDASPEITSICIIDRSDGGLLPVLTAIPGDAV
jgi:hypothetical protein